MDPLPLEPQATPAPLAYSTDRPRRHTLHLWILAAGAMLLELPWVYIVGTMLWDGMLGDAGLISLRGGVALMVLSMPSLLAAMLVMTAIRRSR